MSFIGVKMKKWGVCYALRSDTDFSSFSVWKSNSYTYFVLPETMYAIPSPLGEFQRE